MSLIIFSHANSFPASTYKLLFAQLRRRHFNVRAIDRLGHDPAFPVTDNWPHLVEQLAQFTAAQVARAGEPAWLVGHSLGGLLSVMLAAKRPDLARGVLMIDSPIFGGWRAATLGALKATQILGAVSPGKVSRRRRDHWASREEALAYFQSKKAFSRWDSRVLNDYIAHGLVDVSGKSQSNEKSVSISKGASKSIGKDIGVKLAFSRDIETAIYNTLPDHLDRLFRRHPIKCPVAFIGGTRSVEMRQVGMEMVEKLVRGRISMLEGSHLFPMEKPEATAAAIEAALLGLARN
jgi:pimeloyl-ACP methyl ester carboxylesterase